MIVIDDIITVHQMLFVQVYILGQEKVDENIIVIVYLSVTQRSLDTDTVDKCLRRLTVI